MHVNLNQFKFIKSDVSDKNGNHQSVSLQDVSTRSSEKVRDDVAFLEVIINIWHAPSKQAADCLRSDIEHCTAKIVAHWELAIRAWYFTQVLSWSTFMSWSQELFRLINTRFTTFFSPLFTEVLKTTPKQQPRKRQTMPNLLNFTKTYSY